MSDNEGMLAQALNKLGDDKLRILFEFRDSYVCEHLLRLFKDREITMALEVLWNKNISLEKLRYIQGKASGLKSLFTFFEDVDREWRKRIDERTAYQRTADKK